MRPKRTYSPTTSEATPFLRNLSGPPTTSIEFSMQISDDVLRRATEAQLLTLLITWHEFTRPAEKPLDAIAQAIGINKSTLIQAHAGKGYIGIRHWHEIERRFGFTLWRRWMDLQ